ncbi:MAG: hypothetical protein HC897_10325, partial [Thermoanaerobaculia bacterium]|nr:hypothetical protein [Thermoanaerobaculia bacterium]
MSHPEAAELLPWLVNGTLSGEEASRVREQLRNSEPLRRELRDTVETARLLAEPPSVEAVIDFASGR